MWQQQEICLSCILQVTCGGDLNSGGQKGAAPSLEGIAGAGAQTAVCMSFGRLGASNKAYRSA